MDNVIHIVCATDENYAPFASIMMKSVLMHTKSFINFYILDGGVTARTKKLISKDLIEEASEVKKKQLSKKYKYDEMIKEIESKV